MATRQLFAEQRIGEIATLNPAAAIGFRIKNAEIAERSKLMKQLARKLIGGITANFGCMAIGISPISSKNSVPPCAC